MRSATVVVIALASFAASAMEAQTRWSAEVDLTAAVPTGQLADADLKTGFGSGLNVRYRLQPHLSAYLGWEYHMFKTDVAMGERKLDVVHTGYTFGLRFEHPLIGSTAGWLRAAALANHIELENEAGNIISDTGHGLGYEFGGGLAIPLGSRLSLTPGIRYRSLSRDLNVGTITRASTLSYLTFGSGLAFNF